MTSTLHAALTPQVLSFEKAFRSSSGSSTPTPAALTEAMLPLLDRARWLLVRSSAMAGGNAGTAMNLILDRTAARGVAIAFDLDWQPTDWGLEPGASPTSEVLRRVRPLSDAAALIHCRAPVAEPFFRSGDPAEIHESLPQRPAVLIREETGTVRWCLGGRSGRLSCAADDELVLTRLLDGLAALPGMPADAGRGSGSAGADAIADPDSLSDLLQSAVVRSQTPDTEPEP